MFIRTIEIENYRLLNNISINIDKSATLIVGRNNTGKTSFMALLRKAVNGQNISFHDYPLSSREKLYSLFEQYYFKAIAINDIIKEVPIPSIKFIIDYSEENSEQLLGALSPFIIDMDIQTTTAIILVEYRFCADEQLMDIIISQSTISDKSGTCINRIALRESLIENFSRIFKLQVTAINPIDSSDMQLKTPAELSELFPLYVISAERGLDESDLNNSNPLSPILSKVFQTDIKEENPNVKSEIESLQNMVKTANKDIQRQTNNLLSSIVQKSIDFGYPNAEELQLKANTDISIDNQIKNQTDLTYIEEGTLEELPSTYNGLGYKNLIKIEFELADFAKNIAEKLEISIPILFLEEPESHMHPQLQQTFVKYLEQFLKKISAKPIQVFITTHSSHIVNAVPFNQIRYAQKGNNGVKYKDLSEFCNTNPKNASFLQKYLTLNRCDLFFADKAILIEGAAERLLLPDMIMKCNQMGVFTSKAPHLQSQYYALIEIGGAYAHLFFPFVDFLSIPTLVITDLDSIGENQKKVPVSQGKGSSNVTIKWWVRNALEMKEEEKIDFQKILNFDKVKKTQGYCHIEYQTFESGLCGRSLEESIKNANRKIFGIPDAASESDIAFEECKKTDFAIDLMVNHSDYSTPDYIKRGLIWLDKQKN
jgi:putative ATP-dependent endonuclease of the OLD family